VNIYSKKQRWKWLLLLAAAAIVSASLWYTSQLVRKIADSEKRNVELWAEAVRRKALMMEATSQLYAKIAKEERKKVQLWAEANKLLPQLPDDDAALGFVFAVIVDNETVPVILTDSKGKILLSRNLDPKREKDTLYLRSELAEMHRQHDSIPMEVGPGNFHYLYYRDSEVFTEIRLSFEDNERSFIKEVASNPASAPAIYADSATGNIIAFGNLDSVQVEKDSAAYLQKMLGVLKKEGNRIDVNLGDKKNYIWYMESPQLKQLRYFPYIQFTVIGIFLLTAYFLFSTSRRAEQNHVWVGMAKETAHQLGTPLSSLIAWLEYLQLKGIDPEITTEIGRDVKRLEMITERFSKIGSQPKLKAENLSDALAQAVDYIRARSPKSVEYIVDTGNGILAPLNIPLFAWVIENLCRNAVDAMDGRGSITVTVQEAPEKVIIDITDTGKGIHRSKHKTIFEPGFTTKQRGWGLGLSLCKRIIENYHNGSIFVKRSEPGKGTTFRIELKQ
jgi:two-component sensor histidine kinase